MMRDENYYKKYEPLFGSWYITDKLGEGAIAQVFALERKELGVTYHAALKAITIPESEDEVRSAMADGMTGADLTHYYQTIVQNVVSELEFMSKLKGHSHIVSYEDHRIIEHEDDIGWDILIRIEQLTPLIDYSLAYPLTEADVLQLGIDICKALEYCRQFDILHRDVKPENIFVAPGGDFKLGDFGIARIVEETRMGLSRKGTYTYMAPEVYRGGTYGPSADLYSLGMVMYKFLNDGRNPFMPTFPQQVGADDYDTAFARRISGGAMQEPAHGSAKLRRLILKACAYDPNERFHNAADFRQELELLQYRNRKRRRKGKSSDDALRSDAPKAGQSLDPATGIHAAADGNREGIPGANQPLGGHAAGRVHSEGSAKKKRRAGRIVLFVCMALFLIAGVIDAVIPDEITAITGIDDREEIYIGEKLTPTYTIEPDWFKDEPITFRMEDADIAAVDGEGMVTAETVGETTLEIAAKDYTRQVAIEVMPKVTKISGVKSELKLTEGDTKTLDVTLSPEKFADEPITYKSGDKSIVTVSKKGKLTAKEPGKTKVTIAAGGCTKKVTVEVEEYVAPTQPVTYYSLGSSGAGSRSSGSGSKSSGSKKSSGSSGGYFNSKDDEYF